MLATQSAIRRAAWLGIAITLLLALNGAFAKPISVQEGLRRAYDITMKCTIANGHVSSEFKDAGDTANARLFDANAKKSFDLAYFNGNLLHLSQQQVTDDLNAATNAELPRLVKENGYLTKVAKECKSWGLM